MSEHAADDVPEPEEGIKVDGENNEKETEEESKFGMVVVAGDIEDFDPEGQDGRPFE